MIQANYKHQQLTEALREEILTGKFPQGRFHTVKAMMERFQVSQATLTRALQPLYEEGFIYSVSGKGTFVSRDIECKARQGSVPATIYCIAAYEEMFDPARTSPDWCFTQLMLKGIMQAAKKHNMLVNIAPISTDLETFQSIADRENVMFIFLNYSHCEPLIEYVIRKQIPYSLYLNESINRKMNFVFCDVETAMEEATEYLIGQGHREIAFLGDYNDSPRHRGYRRALRKHGIPQKAEHGWFLYRALPESAQVEVERRLRELPETTAIVASTDLRAIGAYRAMQKLHLNKALISMDNMWKYYNFVTPITSFDMQLEQAGEALFEALQQKQKDGQDRKRTISHFLEKGETA